MSTLTSEHLPEVAALSAQLADVVCPILHNLNGGIAFHALIWLHVSLLAEFAELTDSTLDSAFLACSIEMSKIVQMHNGMKREQQENQNDQ